MFLYHFRICSFVKSEDILLSSSTMLSAFMMLNVGIGGFLEGTIQSIDFVSGLSGAPGKRGLDDC